MDEKLLEIFCSKLEQWVDQYTHDKADSPQPYEYFKYFKDSKEFYIFLEDYRKDIEHNIMLDE